jgi:hypothetical protein
VLQSPEYARLLRDLGATKLPTSASAQ